MKQLALSESEFKDLLDGVKHSVATDDSRPVLQYIRIEVEKKADHRKKEKWQKAFQAYSDKMSQDGTTPSGKCGYMDFCDYCTDNSYGRPCVRAFGKWARANNIQVDYNDFDFTRYI